jgi:DNA-binding NtrC family response regulator
MAAADKGLIGESIPMQRLRALIAKAAGTNLPVLVQGPTGSGKELIAAALHDQSGRMGEFVAFNISALSETVFENELFGHLRGAFTGAERERIGLMRRADRGTLFLDEIGGLALEMQVKLLRAIETGIFLPVGSDRTAHSDFRLVTATNESLHTLVEAGRFRADLALRLNAIVITAPSLEERIEDIPILAQHFLDASVHRGIRITPGAMRTLQERSWPGNVRELQHVVMWAATLAAGEFDVINRGLIAAVLSAEPGSHRIVDHVSAVAQQIRLALVDNSWNVSATALALGIDQSTLYRKIKRFRIKKQ